MLKLNRIVDYGILVLTEIARRNACVSTTELAAVYGISATIVAKVLKKLARAGLVTSERGSRGGYRLALPATGVTLRAVVNALEGPISLTFCSSGTASGRCRTRPFCVASDAMKRLNHLVNGAFEAVTLEDILQAKERPGPVPAGAVT
ncbi:MAG: Rrf2 family transcriptional regulator [Holophagales bacterium]|nr:Rrf2 family transcriptional regulator [Holophagales bacterium]MBK9965643.1 Rrf2 family transcriptional regulator [Holophagales bacterium]